MVCEICGKDYKFLSGHLVKHNISSKDYYDTYIRKLNEGICPVCGKETTWLGISNGYRKYCSCRCANLDPNAYRVFRDNNPQKDEKVREKTKQTCRKKYDSDYAISSDIVKAKVKESTHSKNIDYPGLLKIADVCNKYGSGWYQVRSLLGISTIMKGRYGYISVVDIPKIEAYQHSELRHSKLEYLFSQYIDVNYIKNSRSIIKPYELDFYFPETKIALELNGIYTHCEEFGCPKDYHLMKSLMCRDIGVRLVHIYEFEDLDKQFKLFKELLNGNDLFPKDFNKNNFLEIPKPTIIYEDETHTIYGAGKLIREEE